jgi:hypothetical protein
VKVFRAYSRSVAVVVSVDSAIGHEVRAEDCAAAEVGMRGENASI